jgi:hypothetical protein
MKDQLWFLVTKILGGDFLIDNKQKTPKSIEDRRDAALRLRGCDTTKHQKIIYFFRIYFSEIYFFKKIYFSANKWG